MRNPREFVKKYGPALLCGLRVLQLGLLVGRVLGIPFPNFSVPEDLSGSFQLVNLCYCVSMLLKD